MAFPYDDLVIFEMANNHQGSLEHGLKIIDEMAKITKRFGVRAAVKLQYRDLDTFIHPDFVSRKDVKHIPRFLETRLRWEEFQTLVLATQERGMLSIVTPFDEKSVEIIQSHGVDVIKVASCSCMDWPLLEVIARAGKPIICSTGGCVLSDIDRIVTFFEHRHVKELALLHCVGLYPTGNKDQQLHFMTRMMDRYPNCTVGHSGHEDPDNLRVVGAAVAMGAGIFERHVGVPSDTIKLNAYSMNPEQVERWVEEIVAYRELIGPRGSDKRVGEAEEQSLRSLLRGVFARKAIGDGEAIGPDKVFFAMPCQPGQTTTREYLETMEASHDYEADVPIEENRAYNAIAVMRSVIHEAKGLLREARIAIGSEYEIELSHHYGMERFRKTGAIIISFFNREYCKKLIILLTGQSHPTHAHEKKEETFQVLYGELDLVLDGQQQLMRPGDIQLVRRGQLHSFATRTGCVFEEISTTHIKGDSIYEDDEISRLDPIERKTVIDEW